MFDVLGSGALVIVLSPLLFLVGLAIRLDSPGPVIFRQTRIGGRPDGAGGWRVEPFEVFKFRSMGVDTDPRRHEDHVRAFVSGHLDIEANGSAKIRADGRVTRVGRLIRRTSIDELPQLANVLRGEMSLVGPRPVPDYEVAMYEPWQRQRLLARPGITGAWQVHGRGRVTFEEMVRMDIDYVCSNTIMRDLGLLLMTIPAVVSTHGAE